MLDLGDGSVLLALGDLASPHTLDDASSRSDEVWNYLRSADPATANLELPLTTGGSRAGKAIILRADPEIEFARRTEAVALVGRMTEHSTHMDMRMERRNHETNVVS